MKFIFTDENELYALLRRAPEIEGKYFFYGEPHELTDLLADLGLLSSREELADRWRFESHDGAIVDWYHNSKNRTVFVSGVREARLRAIRNLNHAISEGSPPAPAENRQEGQ